MLQADEAYCTGCGKPRPIVGSGSPDGAQKTVDKRYVVVACGRVKRPGVFDRAVARRVIKERRARVRARKAARALQNLPPGQAKVAFARVK